MTQAVDVEPWKITVGAAVVGFTYGLGPLVVVRGGPWIPFFSVMYAIDQLVGTRTGKPLFRGVGLACGLASVLVFEFGVLRSGVEPRVVAAFAAGVGLLQVLTFSHAARSLGLLADSRRQRLAVLLWAMSSIAVPSAAVLTSGPTRLVLQLSWTLSGVLAALPLLRALDRPAPAAAPSETP